MSTGQHSQPEPGGNRLHRFESCIAHSLPQDSGGFPEQLNTDRTPDGGSVGRATSGDSLAAGGLAWTADAVGETPGVGFLSPSLLSLGGGTTLSLPGFPVGMVSGEMPGRVWKSLHETPTGSTLAPVDRFGGLRGSVGAERSCAPQAGHVRDQQGVVGEQPASPFRPAVGQAAGDQTLDFRKDIGRVNSPACGLSRSQLVALLRASDDVREAVAALMEVRRGS